MHVSSFNKYIHFIGYFGLCSSNSVCSTELHILRRTLNSYKRFSRCPLIMHVRSFIKCTQLLRMLPKHSILSMIVPHKSCKCRKFIIAGSLICLPKKYSSIFVSFSSWDFLFTTGRAKKLFLIHPASLTCSRRPRESHLKLICLVSAQMFC